MARHMAGNNRRASGACWRQLKRAGVSTMLSLESYSEPVERRIYEAAEGA
jgi:hypothetical protein